MACLNLTGQPLHKSSNWGNNLCYHIASCGEIMLHGHVGSSVFGICYKQGLGDQSTE